MRESSRPPWQPSTETVDRAELTHYMRWLRETRGLHFDRYDELWTWSISDLEAFWGSLWEYFEIKASEPYRHVLHQREMPKARWFSGARLSYAEHVFRDRVDKDVAILHASELRPLAETNWGELRDLTGKLATGLRAHGVNAGDRVVGYMPNIVETAASFLACASVGAIWSCCSPDIGVRSVVDRFAQLTPKLLLAVDGYRYGGKDIDQRESIARLETEIPSLEKTIVLPYLGSTGNWDDLLIPGDLEFEQLPFDHPLWVLYSSGTTGLPKAIVHGQGGILLEHLKMLRLHFDLRRDDRLFWFTTTGWMMWNLLLGGLLTKAPVVLYDGNPGYPDLGRLWQLAAEAEISCFGASAAFISACMKARIEPRHEGDLAKLRSVGSTGSPLAPEAFRWISDHVREDIWLFSTSGGTDVCSAFVGGVPTLPVYDGELQARSLGAAVQAFDAHGYTILDQVGELVLTAPMPSMPIFLWGDEDGSLYHESYFSLYPGVWRHGDWIEITSKGTAVIYGRSDSTINRGGIRIGTSELYRIALSFEELTDALAVDVPREGTDGWLILYVVLRDGSRLDETLEKALAARIKRDGSPRHVPNEIRAVPDVPRTRSGKLLEIPVKRILMGADPQSVASLDSLANPAALRWFIEEARLNPSTAKPGR